MNPAFCLYLLTAFAAGTFMNRNHTAAFPAGLFLPFTLHKCVWAVPKCEPAVFIQTCHISGSVCFFHIFHPATRIFFTFDAVSNATGGDAVLFKTFPAVFEFVFIREKTTAAGFFFPQKPGAEQAIHAAGRQQRRIDFFGHFHEIYPAAALLSARIRCSGVFEATPLLCATLPLHKIRFSKRLLQIRGCG